MIFTLTLTAVEATAGEKLLARFQSSEKLDGCYISRLETYDVTQRLHQLSAEHVKLKAKHKRLQKRYKKQREVKQ